MKIDDKLIKYLEDLSYLALSQDEKDKLKGDLQRILQYMSGLETLDTTGIAECTHPFDNVNGFREDVPGDPFGRELILQNAPVKNDEAFIAPKTVE